jgi:hypothetical protein
MFFILNSQLLLASNMFSTEYVGFLANYNTIFILNYAQLLPWVIEEELEVLLRIYKIMICGQQFFKHNMTNLKFQFL